LWVTSGSAALVRMYALPAPMSGALMGVGASIAMGYLISLPWLPSMFNKQRPLNVLTSYLGMFLGWVIMLIAVFAELPAPFFLFGFYFFQTMGIASQVVLLECLTGICNLEATTRIMGISEVVGCVFGMVGGYLGEALLAFGIATPFSMCSVWSLISVIFLTASFSLRASQREGEGDSFVKATADGLVSIVRSERKQFATFIGAERAMRGSHLMTNTSEPLLKDTVSDLASEGANSQSRSVPEPFMSNLSVTLSEDDDVQAITAPGTPMHSARAKRLAASFHLAYIDLDPPSDALPVVGEFKPQIQHATLLDARAPSSKHKRFASV